MVEDPLVIKEIPLKVPTSPPDYAGVEVVRGGVPLSPD